jgi:hypothetical protein
MMTAMTISEGVPRPPPECVACPCRSPCQRNLSLGRREDSSLVYICDSLTTPSRCCTSRLSRRLILLLVSPS